MAPTQLSKPRKSKVKNAAVWGLSLVLAAVLFRQFGGSSSAPAATKAAALVPPAKSAAGAPLRLTIPNALPRDLFNVAAVFPRDAAAISSAGPKADDAPDLRATVVAEAQ